MTPPLILFHVHKESFIGFVVCTLLFSSPTSPYKGEVLPLPLSWERAGVRGSRLRENPRCRQRRLFRESHHQVHGLDGLSGRTFHQVVQGRYGDDVVCSFIHKTRRCRKKFDPRTWMGLMAVEASRMRMKRSFA